MKKLIISMIIMFSFLNIGQNVNASSIIEDGIIQKNDGKSILKIVYTYEVADSIRKELVDHNNDYYELYKLSKNDDGFIVLDVELAILDEYAEMMDTMWKEAVVLIKSTYDKI